MENLVKQGKTVSEIQEAVFTEAINKAKKQSEKNKLFSTVSLSIKYGFTGDNAIVIVKRKPGKNNWEVIGVYDQSKKKRKFALAVPAAAS